MKIARDNVPGTRKATNQMRILKGYYENSPGQRPGEKEGFKSHAHPEGIA